MKKFLLKLSAVLAVATLCSAAQAQTLLNLEINGGNTSVPPGDQSYSGAAYLGQPGDAWNHITLFNIDQMTPTSAFVYADGSSATGISITNIHNWDLTGAIPLPGVSGNALLQSYMGASPTIGDNNASTLTISGLTAGGSYNLYVIASSGHQGVGGIFSVNGSPTQALFGALGPNFTLGIDTLLFQVTADGLGNITLSETADPSVHYRVLNGLQLEAVPEPSTCLLLGLGGMMLLGRARRRKTSPAA